MISAFTAAATGHMIAPEMFSSQEACCELLVGTTVSVILVPMSACAWRVLGVIPDFFFVFFLGGVHANKPQGDQGWSLRTQQQRCMLIRGLQHVQRLPRNEGVGLGGPVAIRTGQGSCASPRWHDPLIVPPAPATGPPSMNKHASRTETVRLLDKEYCQNNTILLSEQCANVPKNVLNCGLGGCACDKVLEHAR